MIKKYTVITLLTAISLPAFANINANNGFYAGGALSIATFSPINGSSFNDSFLPFRSIVSPVIGYHFNDYLALESSFNSIQNSHNKVNGIFGADHYRLYTIDLAAKLILPFESGISLFALAGGAYAHQSVFNQTYVTMSPKVNDHSNNIMPLVGVGLGYNFTNNFGSTLSVKHMHKSGNIGNINIIGLGLTYTFSGLS